MGELQRLTAAHAPALLAFETANRAWFARSIADRGDDYDGPITLGDRPGLRYSRDLEIQPD